MVSCWVAPVSFVLAFLGILAGAAAGPDLGFLSLGVLFFGGLGTVAHLLLAYHVNKTIRDQRLSALVLLGIGYDKAHSALTGRASSN